MGAVSDSKETPDRARLARALEAANLPTLLMVLFQITGDRRWLQDPYRPTRTKGMSDHDSGGFSPQTQWEIRAAAVEVLTEWQSSRRVEVAAPRDSLLVEMMSVCMGEPVPAEFEPMMAEEMGFSTPEPPPEVADDDFQVVVIGAGVSGLLASLRLREAGIDHVVLEKNDSIGGTWLNNSYPGAGVDTPSYLYSFSFYQRPWTTHFGKRDEVLGYIADMARKHGLLDRVHCGTEAVSATYDEAARKWTVRAQDSQGSRVLIANAVITAVGQLNRPKIPAIPGASEFRGEIFHSACWPRDLDVTGRRVAVVGTGASAMQIVPAIAERVEHLTVFQRSPQWVAPNANYFRQVGDDTHYLMENVPFYAAWYRFRLAWTFNDKVHASLQKDADWPYPEKSINAVNDGHRRFFTKYLVDQLASDEDLIRKTLPAYPPFGKRMLLDNGWFAALRRDNVDLVTDPVVSITDGGLVTDAGDVYPADVIVLATGFEARRLLTPMDIRGRGGASLRETWGDDDASAYLGMSTPNFPNLFFMYGPNTNLGHGGSYIFIAECQARYIVDLLRTMVIKGIAAAECRPEVHDSYNQLVDEAHEKMIWTHPGMDTWYRNKDGRVVTNSPWRVVDYWRMTRLPHLDDYSLEPAT